MFVEKKIPINIENLKSEVATYTQKAIHSEDNIEQVVQFIKLEHIYGAALEEISTKLHILDQDFQLKNAHNPIHHMERRVKKNTEPITKAEAKRLRNFGPIRTITYYGYCWNPSSL